MTAAKDADKDAARDSAKIEVSGGNIPACLTPHDQGVVLAVRAQPASKKTGFLGMVADAARLGVGAPPEDGKANDALIELIARLLNVRKSQIALVQGKSSRQKRFLVRGLSLPEAQKVWLKSTESSGR